MRWEKRYTSQYIIYPTYINKLAHKQTQHTVHFLTSGFYKTEWYLISFFKLVCVCCPGVEDVTDYDPNLLSDPQWPCGKHKRVLIFASYMVKHFFFTTNVNEKSKLEEIIWECYGFPVSYRMLLCLSGNRNNNPLWQHDLNSSIIGRLLRYNIPLCVRLSQSVVINL